MSLNHLCLYVILCLSGTFVHAQDPPLLWLFSRDVALDFRHDVSVPLYQEYTNGVQPHTEGLALAFSQEHDLLFYTDGETIWDPAHQVKPNGDSLGGSYSSANGVAVCKENDNPTYHIYSVESLRESGKLFKTTLNFISSGGTVIEKRVVLYDNLCEGIISVPHACEGSWIIGRERAGDFVALHVIKGELITVVRSEARPLPDQTANKIGQLRYSTTSNMLAWMSPSSDGYTDLLHFNPSTGEFLTFFNVPTDSLGSIEIASGTFSPNGHYFYTYRRVETAVGTYSQDIIQVSLLDLDSENISAAVSTIGTTPNLNFEYSATFLNGPDKKIYIVNSFGDHIQRINSPDNEGTLADWDHLAIPIPPRAIRSRCAFVGVTIENSLPDLNLPSDTSICEGTDLEIFTPALPGSFRWNDGLDVGPRNITMAGSYILEYRDENNCISTDTIHVEQPSLHSQKNISICEGDSIILNGHAIKSPGIYIDSSSQFTPCAPKNEITLTTNPNHQLNISIEARASYVWNGEILNQSGIYETTYKNTHGCDSTVTLALKILKEEKAKVFLPSSFSPNNDGVNDVLQLYGENIQEFNASIFDRWGGLLSKSTDPNNIWDGEANRSLVREGVYVIVIQYKLSEDQSPRQLSQNITVIR